MQGLIRLFRFWIQGIRLYLTVGISLLTVETWWWATVTFDTPQLRTIRLQEAYAWLSIVLLALALMIGPLTKALPQLPGKPIIRDARRMIGIGAFWFALLHAGIVYLKQFGSSNPFELPTLYRQSLSLGLIGLICLLLLAATSVNAIMRAWGVWWFRLHRLIYVTALAALMHAFMVGAHASSLVSLIALGAVSFLWIGLQLYLLLKEPDRSIWFIISLSYGTLLLIAVLNYGLTQYLGENALTGGHGH